MPRSMIALTVLLLAFAACARPTVYSSLTGEFVITGEETLDPPPGQTNDRVGLFLSGDSAKQVYDAMTVNAAADACEEGMRRKAAGGLVCTLDRSGGHSCSVEILLTSGETKPIGVC